MSGRSRRIVTPVEEVATVAVSHDAEGIVREGKTAFVAGALPGESIRFRRTRRHRQHDEAELLEVLRAVAGAGRAAMCAHFGVCGGCALQHLDPEAQLEAKQTELRDNLERVGRVIAAGVASRRCGARSGTIGAVPGSASKYVTKKGRVVVGFRERLAPYVAEVQRCEVLAEPVGELIAPLAVMLNGLSIRHRLPQIEVAVADNVVALVLRVLDAPRPTTQVRLREFAAARSVRFYLQTGGLDSVRRPGQRIRGTDAGPALRLATVQLQLEFTPTDFIQINARINAALVARAVELLDLDPVRRARSVLRPGQLHTGAGAQGGPGRRCGRRARAGGAGPAQRRASMASPMPNSTSADLARATPNRGSRGCRNAYTHVLLDPPRAGPARCWLPSPLEAAAGAVYFLSSRQPCQGYRDRSCTNMGSALRPQGCWTCFRIRRTSSRWRCWNLAKR